MLDRILFPTDGSAGAMSTLEHALDLATDHDATVHVLTVQDEDIEDEDEDAGTELVELAADRVRERGLTPRTAIRSGRPYRQILDYADAEDVDLIVMPTHGRTGLERLLLGSVTARVIRLSDVPVLTACPDAELRYPYRRILVPTDGSRCANAALDVAVTLASVADVPLTALSVVEGSRNDANVRSSASRDRIDERAHDAVETAADVAREASLSDVSTAVVHGSSVHNEIEALVAENPIDLIVVGTHGRTGIDRYLFGGVTEKLVRTADVPVLTVREPNVA
ncbi:UspA domain protein [Halorhabdus tiamatea SARL4B]|uniref:Universal stress protein A (UpsA) domain protein n=1 Tax=Halorhabdus tiamatea SARL4B TaxID=1033806 RepID=F7PHR8_9EURY|nr:universal stress protein [Halorhabdus tiamatea]ERJ06912.1 UspA domain protein [Halorhabdus tiamatea SARL4B]CCQ32384.1 universal stress protein A (UpsA) domain protein [Halorhabdus tiamatea SARL4B]